ncbi:transcription factor BIM2-like [Aristolochia californica]|uniref:transcription factor BIM2-like n=1 Tax=Aristolochia californica TaxID=171875 RepID=UPI0035DD361B
MERPHPRPFGTEDKKSTHNFLSLYSESSFQHQDPRPASQGFYPKTHDFLQPLERVDKNNGSGEGTKELTDVEKSSSVEHALPGGIGTYSISHISNFARGIVKPERTILPIVQVNSTDRKMEPNRVSNGCQPYNGGAFTLWDEKAAGKDKVGGQPTREPVEKLGQWSSERSSAFISRNGGSLSSFSSSKQQQQQGGNQKNHSFMEMMKSARSDLPEEEDDDEEDCVKKEDSSQKGDMGLKVDSKGNDHKAVTPRSKHSATEQRRRSKINDRFQILRGLIPHSDQKRDKASFLLEVIEHIQFLQEKVHKYEAAFPGCDHENMKLMPWNCNQGPGENIPEHAQVVKKGPGGGLMFTGKFDDNSVAVSPAMLRAAQNPLESDIGTVPPYKPMDHQPTGLGSKGVSIPLQQTLFPPVVRSGGRLAQPSQRLMSDADSMAHQWPRPSTAESDSTEQEDMTIEGGTIRMSGFHSQGLFSSLAQALQNSGIDLSRANFSLQIDLGKRASRPATTTSSAKDHEDPSSGTRAMAHSRVASSGEDSDPPQKRFRRDSS